MTSFKACLHFTKFTRRGHIDLLRNNFLFNLFIFMFLKKRTRRQRRTEETENISDAGRRVIVPSTQMRKLSAF